MPVKDTIQTWSDSARLVMDSLQHSDSLLHADSLAKADSIARADSIALHAFKGFDGVLPAGYPQDQNWVFFVLLFLFGVVVLSFIRAIASPLEMFATFLISKDRTSIFNKTSIDSFEQKVYFFIFSVICISLFGYLIFYMPGTAFSFYTYLQLVVLLLVFFLLKYLTGKFTAYVFIDKGTLKLVTDAYLNVVSIIALLFYPVLLIQLYTPGISSNFAATSGLIIIVLGLILYTAKLVQIFFHKVVVSLYLLLYLCTLEILPVIIAIQVFQFLANKV